MPPLSARAQHTGSSARVVHTPNKCSVGYGVRPEESFLDWLCVKLLSQKPQWQMQNAPSLVVKPGELVGHAAVRGFAIRVC